MWKVQTEEQAPLWCKLLVFTQSGGKCFMPTIILHQAKDYSKDLHFNITLDFTVHHILSGYMDRYGWLKSMTQLSDVCSASTVKNQIISFDGYDIHFDDCALIHMYR